LDHLTAFVCVAHLKLRLDLYCKYPKLFHEVMRMDKRPPLYIPRPVELAGMRSRLQRSQQQARAIADTGKVYDEVMDGIDEAHKAIQGHVFDLRGIEGALRSQISGMLERSNGSPTDGESDGRQSPSGDDDEEMVVISPEPSDQADKVSHEAPTKETAGSQSSSASFPEGSTDHS
jgi:hypothetical protein